MAEEKFPGMDAAINRVLGEDPDALQVPGELFLRPISVEELTQSVAPTFNFDVIKEIGGPILDFISKQPVDAQASWQKAAIIVFLSVDASTFVTAKAVELMQKTYAMLPKEDATN